MVKPVESIVIVGSGFAAWSSACLLARALGGRVSLRVVSTGDDESLDDLLGSCGPAIPGVHRSFDVDEPGFMRATAATFKLGTEMTDWNATGSSYLHAFGDIGARLDSVAFHQLMNRVRLASRPVPKPEECSLAATAARLGRFAHPAADRRSVNSTYDYAYQFDGQAASAYFRALAQRLGVRQHVGALRDVIVGENGFIEALLLESGERIAAGLFLDCSGAASRLLGQALGVPFESWSRWLPCDRVQRRRVGRPGAPPPFASAAARAAGWRLRLSLQAEDIHAFFYASGHCGDESAAAEFGTGTPQAPSSFASGRRRQFWSGNCVAIGAAAGLVDPVAGVSVQLIYDAVVRLLGLFPHEDCTRALVGEYERLTTLQYERARDFAALSFRLSARQDSAFWRECARAPLPEELGYRLQLFEHGGRLAQYDDELFGESDWVSAFLGHGRWPHRPDPLTLSMDVDGLAHRVQRMREVMHRAAEALPSHGNYLKQLGFSGSQAPDSGAR